MALIQMSFLSNALKRTVPVTVILPVDNTAIAREKTVFPTLYLLHGLLGSHSDWVCNTRIRQWAEERGLTVVMISHDVQAAMQEADHILHLSNSGSFYGTPFEYRHSDLGLAFFGGCCCHE